MGQTEARLEHDPTTLGQLAAAQSRVIELERLARDACAFFGDADALHTAITALARAINYPGY